MVQARAIVALVLLLVLSSAVTLALYPKVSKAHHLVITRSTYDPRREKLSITVESEGGPCKLKALIVNCGGSIISIPLGRTVENVTSFSVKTNLSEGCLISVVAEDGAWASFREEGISAGGGL